MIKRLVLFLGLFISLIGISFGATIINSLPYTISSSGSYELGANLTVIGDDGITINVNNVNLDCRGYSIDGVSSDYSWETGIIINNHNYINVSNCTIKHFEQAIGIYGTSKYNTVNNVNISNSYTGIEFPYDSNNYYNISFINVIRGIYGTTIYASKNNFNNLKFKNCDSAVVVGDNNNLSNFYLDNCSLISIRSNNKLTNINNSSITLMSNNSLSNIFNSDKITVFANNNTLSNISFIEASKSLDLHSNACNNFYSNLSFSDGQSIMIYNYSINIDGWTNISHLYLCDADYSNISNLNIGTDNKGIFLSLIDINNSFFSNFSISNYTIGIMSINSSKNTFNNISLSQMDTGIEIENYNYNFDFNLITITESSSGFIIFGDYINISNSTFLGSGISSIENEFSNIGLGLYGKNSNLDNVTILNFFYGIYADYVWGNQNITVINSNFNNNNNAIYQVVNGVDFITNENITVKNSIMYNNDLDINRYCSIRISNVSDNFGRYKYQFYNTSVFIDGWTNISSLILCNVSNSEIKNLNYVGNDNNNFIYLAAVQNSNFTNINLSKFNVGIHFGEELNVNNFFNNLNLNYNVNSAMEIGYTIDTVFKNINISNNPIGLSLLLDTGWTGNVRVDNSVIYDNNININYNHYYNNLACIFSFSNVSNAKGKYYFLTNESVNIDGWSNITSINLCGVSNSNIKNLNFTNLDDENVIFLDLAYVFNSNFSNITISNYTSGIELNVGENNTFTDIEVTNSLNEGILIFNPAENNTFKNINSKFNNIGFSLNWISNNFFINIDSSNNVIGFVLDSAASNNFIINSTFINNLNYSLYFSDDWGVGGSSDNFFYGNIFESSDKIFEDDPNGYSTPINFFNSSLSGYNIGNYWGDFGLCSAREVRGNYNVCTNPSNYSVNSTNGVYDFAPLIITASYILPTPADNSNYGGENFTIKVNNTYGLESIFNVTLNGQSYVMTNNGDGTYEYTTSYNLITNVTFEVFVNSIGIGMRTFTYYPNHRGEAFGFESYIAGAIAVLLILFGGFYIRK